MKEQGSLDGLGMVKLTAGTQAWSENILKALEILKCTPCLMNREHLTYYQAYPLLDLPVGKTYEDRAEYITRKMMAVMAKLSPNEVFPPPPPRNKYSGDDTEITIIKGEVQARLKYYRERVADLQDTAEYRQIYPESLQRQLAKTGQDQVWLDPFGYIEDTQCRKGRAKAWEFMKRSVKGTWAASLFTPGSQVRQYDLGAVYEQIMDHGAIASGLRFCTIVRDLVNTPFKPGGNLYEYTARISQKRKEYEEATAMDPDCRLPDHFMVALVLEKAVQDKRIQEEALKIADNLLPKNWPSKKAETTLEKVINQLAEKSDVSDAYLKSSQDHRSNKQALSANLVKGGVEIPDGVCHFYYMGADCPYSRGTSSCSFRHEGPKHRAVGKKGDSKGSQWTQGQAKPGSEMKKWKGKMKKAANRATKVVCGRCGSVSHKATACSALHPDPDKVKLAQSKIREQATQDYLASHPKPSTRRTNLVIRQDNKTAAGLAQARKAQAPTDSYESALDSGAAGHISGEKRALTRNVRPDTSILFEGFDSSLQRSELVGDIVGRGPPLTDVAYVPDSRNLSSVGVFADQGLISVFGKNGWMMVELDWETLRHLLKRANVQEVATGRRSEDGLYMMKHKLGKVPARLAGWNPAGPGPTLAPSNRTQDQDYLGREESQDQGPDCDYNIGEAMGGVATDPALMDDDSAARLGGGNPGPSQGTWVQPLDPRPEHPISSGGGASEPRDGPLQDSPTATGAVVRLHEPDQHLSHRWYPSPEPEAPVEATGYQILALKAGEELDHKPAGLARTFRGNQDAATLCHNRQFHLHSQGCRPCYPEVSFPDAIFCDGCIMAKHTRGSFKPSDSKMKFLPGECWSVDGKGFFIKSYGGSTYNYLFVDRRTGYVEDTYTPDRTDDNFVANLKEVVVKSKSMTGRNVKILHSDNAKELVSAAVEDYLREIGARPTRTGDYAPEQDPAERYHRTFAEGVAAAFATAGHPPARLWAECRKAMSFTWNNRRDRETKPGSKTYVSRTCLMENHDRVFDQDLFRTWCTLCYVWIPKDQRTGAYGTKRFRSFRAILVGYALNKAGYRVMNLKTREITESIYAHVICHENIFPFRNPITWTPEDIAQPQYYFLPETQHCLNFEEALATIEDDDIPATAGGHPLRESIERGVQPSPEASTHPRHQPERQYNEPTVDARRNPNLGQAGPGSGQGGPGSGDPGQGDPGPAQGQPRQSTRSNRFQGGFNNRQPLSIEVGQSVSVNATVETQGNEWGVHNDPCHPRRL